MVKLAIEDILAKSNIADLTGEYALMRQDTHGCEYFMRGGLSEQAADYLVQYFTGLGHHQSYWSEVPKNNHIPELLPPVPMR